MIPALVTLGSPAPWAVLPPGVHDATLAEVAIRFAITPHRRHLYDGLVRAVAALRHAGCTEIYVDGSFTSDCPTPGDFDGCWSWHGVDLAKLDPVLLDFADKRAAQKRKYFGEFFIAETEGVPGLSFLDFFQIEKFSQKPKGIIRLAI